MINRIPVTNALNKYIGSEWAPDLVKYKNECYIYFPSKNEFYFVTASSIKKPWSDPVNLNISNIDPSNFVDENGKRYLYFSNGDYVPLSDSGLAVIGEIKYVYHGWLILREWTVECFCYVQFHFPSFIIPLFLFVRHFPLIISFL